jgi:hypothetical protein
MSRALVLALSLLLVAAPAAGQEDEEPQKPFDPSSLRVTPPSSRLPLLGTFRYESPFDGAVRRLVIREPEESFWRFEGRAPAGGEALLKLDPVGGLGAYRGEVEPGFDSCLPPGGRVESVLVYPGSLSVDVAVGFVPPEGRDRQERCGPAITWVLLARAGGTAVRLAPGTEIRPRTRLFDVSQNYVDSRVGFEPGGDLAGTDLTRGDKTSFSLDAPKVPPGSAVRVIQVIEDMSGITWHRVEVLDPPAAPAGEGGAEGEGEAGEAGETRPSKGPVSGWVRAEQVVGRLSYTLERE